MLLPMTCVGHSGWLYKLYLHPRHQRSQRYTDEARKAETALSENMRKAIYVAVNMSVYGPGNHLKNKLTFLAFVIIRQTSEYSR